MAKKTINKNWADRGIVYSPIKYGLFITEDSYRKQLKEIEYDSWNEEEFIPKGFWAVVNTFEEKNGTQACFVCLDYERCKTIKPHQVYALIVHEAVHIWQRIKKSLNEKSPSKEFEAYSMQNICEELFYLYEQLVKQ